MAAIRYIGHYDPVSEGKVLWEILCQLKGLGVGRYVTKTDWNLKWADEPSYLKIIKARPAMDRWLQLGKVWGEWTFRGRNLGIYEFGADLNRTDWKLIHRHEEKKYLENKNKMSVIDLPNSFPLPPLQVLIAKRYASKTGQKWDEKQERAPLKICLDPQFRIYKDYMQQSAPTRIAKSIYEETDPEVFLSLYGAALPTQVETWQLGPAAIKVQFKD